MKDLELTIYRHTPNTEPDRNNIGDLHIENDFFCHTLEDEIRPDGVKIYGKTAIPAGRYEVIMSFSNRFQRVMPLLLDVPMFEGVRIHGGNTSEHTHGCPLVAFNTDGKKIWKTAEKQLTEILLEAIEEDRSIFITIKNSFLSYDKKLKKDTLT